MDRSDRSAPTGQATAPYRSDRSDRPVRPVDANFGCQHHATPQRPSTQPRDKEALTSGEPSHEKMMTLTLRRETAIGRPVHRRLPGNMQPSLRGWGNPGNRQSRPAELRSRPAWAASGRRLKRWCGRPPATRHGIGVQTGVVLLTLFILKFYIISLK